MSELIIEKKLNDKNEKEAIIQAYNSNFPNLGYLLGKVLNIPEEYLCNLNSSTRNINISLHCNWLSSSDLREFWNKMTKGNYTWNKIKVITDSSKAQYHIIINSTTDSIDFSKSILFQMEPHMKSHPEKWGEWSDPNPQKFLKIFTHENSYNNCEWHLGSTYSQLCERVNKNPDLSGIISSVLSSKYSDPGHKKRIDFAKFLDTKEDITLHVFGADLNYKNYKGSPPYHNKNSAMLPYFYTFNVENHDIPNYFTEKIIDGILSETLTFYHGSKNIRDYFDERAFVYLPLEDFEADYALIKKVISEDWRTLRLPYIRKEKNRILNEMQFFPRLENIIKNIENN